MGLVFIPLYIKYLGIESYGLIGLFALLQAWLGLLDMGITPTLNREMARFTGGGHSAQSIRDLLRSIEYIVAGVALLIGLGIWAASDWLASDWLRANELPIDAVAQAFGIMGIVTALRFIEGIYRSAVIGLQKQISYNLINSLMATLRGFGAVGTLMWVAPTIDAFFIWQGVVSIITLVVLAVFTYRTLPIAERGGRFSLASLRCTGRFAAGMLGITLLSLLLTQVDKVLLSKLLSLSEYGYYTLASVVAGALSLITGPILQAWFPRLCELVQTNREAELIEKYHQGAQLVTVLMGSSAIILIVFSEPILLLWTQNPELANRSATLLSLLTLGNMLNGLMWIPYQTQLAHGWTSLANYINLISIVIIIPAILWITPRFGAEGAALVWVGLNAGYALIGVHFMYRKILTTEKWQWYWRDVLAPLVPTAIAVIWLRELLGPIQGTWVLLGSLTAAVCLAILVACACANRVNSLALFYLTKWFQKGREVI